jgi:hypothetical protein
LVRGDDEAVGDPDAEAENDGEHQQRDQQHLTAGNRKSEVETMFAWDLEAKRAGRSWAGATQHPELRYRLPDAFSCRSRCGASWRAAWGQR